MKRLKEYPDSNGVSWVRFDTELALQPDYDVPTNVPTEIKDYMLSCLSHNEHSTVNTYCFKLITLPFYSVPMWVKRQEDILSILDYSYSVCCQCGQVLTTPGQLCVLFLLVMDENKYLSMTWQIQLQCMCSIVENMYDTLSYFPFMLHVHSCLTDNIESGWNQFIEYLDTRNQIGNCNICGIQLENKTMTCCNNVVCNLVRNQKRENQKREEKEEEQVTDFMDEMMTLFFTSNVDLISPLLSPVCYEKTCRIRLRSLKDLVSKYECCEKCRLEIYCSKECFNKNAGKHALNKCKSYLDIFI